MRVLICRPIVATALCTAPCACLLLLAAGCAWKSTYDEAVAEREGARAELQNVTVEQNRLAEQAKAMEPLTRQASQQAEQANASLRDAIDRAEAERKIGEERQAKLARLVDQLVAQQSSLRQAMRRAKAEQPGLQAAVDKYRAQLDEADRVSAAAAFPPPPPSVQDPITSASAPPLPASPHAPTMTQTSLSSPAPAASHDPLPAPTTRPATKRGVEPAEEGFLAAMTDWLVSLWRSVFS
ncbi:MAG: hypothetical protein P0111_09800 [Nitrospira sp.]|nr:hypothetical protein [Nitrospira sp.]